MHALSPSSLFASATTLVRSLVLSGEKRRNIRDAPRSRSSFPLSLFFPLLFRVQAFQASGSSSVHRETEHVFCFSPPVCFRRYTRERPLARSLTHSHSERATFFFNSRSALSKDNTTKQFSKVTVPSRSLSRSRVWNELYQHTPLDKTISHFPVSLPLLSPPSFLLNPATRSILQ